MLKEVNKNSTLVLQTRQRSVWVKVRHSKAASDKACRNHEAPRKMMLSLG